MESLEQVEKSMCPGFRVKFEEFHKKSIDLLTQRIKEIADDNKKNHKYERFRMACENYLKEHLRNIIINYYGK